MSRQIITTVTAPAVAAAPAGAYDLTDLATVHDEFDINTADTTKDGFLQRAITQASSAIGNYCNRVFQVESLTDLIYSETFPRQTLQYWGNPAPLQLGRWPIVSVSSVVQTQSDGTTKSLVLGTDYNIDSDNGWLIRLDASGCATAWENLRVTVAYKAGYTKTIYREAGTIPVTPGPYTITVAKAANFAADGGVVYSASSLPLTAVASSPAVGQYSVSAAGVYTFNSAETTIAVLISYLYAAIPDDLVDACLRLVTARFKSRGRDPFLRSQGETIGQQQYWVGPMIGQNGALPPEIQALVDTYRVPVVA